MILNNDTNWGNLSDTNPDDNPLNKRVSLNSNQMGNDSEEEKESLHLEFDWQMPSDSDEVIVWYFILVAITWNFLGNLSIQTF